MPCGLPHRGPGCGRFPPRALPAQLDAQRPADSGGNAVGHGKPACGVRCLPAMLSPKHRLVVGTRRKHCAGLPAALTQGCRTASGAADWLQPGNPKPNPGTGIACCGQQWRQSTAATGEKLDRACFPRGAGACQVGCCQAGKPTITKLQRKKRTVHGAPQGKAPCTALFHVLTQQG